MITFVCFNFVQLCTLVVILDKLQSVFCNEKNRCVFFFFTSWALQSILDFQIFAGTILTFQEIHLQMSLSRASSNHCTYKLFTACWALAIPSFSVG